MKAILRILGAVLLLAGLSWPAAAGAESPGLKAELARFAATAGPYSLAVLGDNRSGDRVYAKIVHQMMLRGPLFAVNTGDLIPHPGNREQWANFRRISRPIDVPYFLTVGNHDVDDRESERIWQEEVDLPGNELYYHFVVGRDLFVVLNSCDPAEDRQIVGQQLAWLARTLDPARHAHQFVFLHHPLFLWKGASHEGRSLDRYPAQRDRLHELFVRKGVTAVFVGHEHTYHRMEREGIDYIVTGGGGAPLYGKEPFNNFLIVRVEGPRVEAKAFDREGQLRDEFVIAR